VNRTYISDTVVDGKGKPVVGALVTLLRASDYSSRPTSDPGSGSANYIAQTSTAAGGLFSFDHIPPDDYHVMVQYSGQTQFHYNVSAIPAEMVSVPQKDGRCLIPRTLEKLIAGENVCIHFVGDSITVGYNSTGTVGGNFVQRMGVLIGQQLVPTAQVNRYDPNAYSVLNDGPINGWNGPTVIQHSSAGNPQTVQVVNNGVSGDTVQRVLRRIGNLTGWTPPIDLFVILLGINDSLTTDPQKFVPPDIFASGIRSLTEILKNYYPQAEIALCTPTYNDQPDAAGTYTLEQYAMATRRAAIETGTALVDLHALWADMYDADDPNWEHNDGYGWWLNTAGGNHTHPTDQGHQGIAEEMFKLFGDAGLAAGRPQRLSTLGPRRRFKEHEVVRIPNNHPAISYGQNLVPPGNWHSYTPSFNQQLIYSPVLMRSKDTNDTLMFEGRMEDVWLLCRRGRDSGMISVHIDGIPQVYGPAGYFLDTFRAYPTNISDTGEDGATYPMDRMLLARSLPEGDHSVMITVLGGPQKNPAATDCWVYVDGLEYTRHGYTARRLECPQELSSVQYGSFTCNLNNERFGTVYLIQFPKLFVSGNIPAVTAVCNQVDHYCSVDGVTPSEFNLRVVHRDGSNETNTVTGQWIAIG
jgi:lysophospholipase L1-like esterase